jgi:diacylglycerol kinase (CTP)
MTTPGTATVRARSTSTQRSPSPVVYRSSALPADSAKGVKDITRKVLRQLEGLGHIEVGDDMLSEDEHERVNGNGVHAIPNGKPVSRPNGHTNGNGVAKPAEKPVDYEIPRKLLHGSIGTSWMTSSPQQTELNLIRLSGALSLAQ